MFKYEIQYLDSDHWIALRILPFENQKEETRELAINEIHKYKRLNPDRADRYRICLYKGMVVQE